MNSSTSAPNLSSLDLAALDSIQAEFDELQGAPQSTPDGSTQRKKDVVMGSSVKDATKIVATVNQSGIIVPMSADGQRSVVVGGAGAGTSSGIQQVVMSTAPKTVQAIVKRPGANTTGQVVTKVIITKNPNTNQPQPVPVSLHANHSAIFATSVPQVLNAAPAGTLTPTKTISISQGGILSPSKGLVSLTGTPIKQGANKIAISPVKTPTKITMIPIAKSPQKIVPFPGQNVFTMVAKTVASATNTVTSSHSKPATITMSPSKVIIKQQPQVSFISVQL